MPKIRHWFPVEQYFLQDPELLALRLEFGDWAALVWLEILSLADRNDGIVKGTEHGLAGILARVNVQWNPKWAAKRVEDVKAMFRRMECFGWIATHFTKEAVEEAFREPSETLQRWLREPSETDQKPLRGLSEGFLEVSKYWKYHRSPGGPNPPNPPNRKEEEYKKKKVARQGSLFVNGKGVGKAEGFEEFWAVYPKRVDRKETEKVWNKLSPNKDLRATILTAIRHQLENNPDPKYWKAPHRWLNHCKWLDETGEPKEVIPTIVSEADGIVQLSNGRGMLRRMYDRKYGQQVDKAMEATGTMGKELGAQERPAVQIGLSQSGSRPRLV